MGSSSQIIIQFTTDFPDLFGNMEKYIPFINHQLTTETKNKFYMESITNGLVYVYADFETFQLMNQPYDLDIIEHFKATHELKLNPMLLTENIINDQNFPAGGLHFQYKIVAPQREKIKSIILQHFQSFLGCAVIETDHQEYDLRLNLQSFECIVLYTNLVSSMYSGILTHIEGTSSENKSEDA